MKAIYKLSILAALAIVGCSKVEPEQETSEENQEIAFTANKYVSGTKADPDPKPLEVSSFNVIGYYTGTDDWDEIDIKDAVRYMPNVLISKQEVTPSTDPKTYVWKSASGTYYWPKTGQMSFVGHAGWGVAATISEEDKASLLTFTDQVIAADSDPMVSDMAVNHTANPTSATYFAVGVPMLFHHAAARVAFKGVAETSTGSGTGLEYEVQITNVTIEDMYTKNTYTVDCSSATIAGTWGDTPSVAADRTIISTAQTLSGTASDLGTVGTVLPQNIESLKASVSYTIIVKRASDHTSMSSDSFTAEVALGSDSLAEWKQNTVYTYTIKISPVSGEITFDPAVVDWSKVDAESASI